MTKSWNKSNWLIVATRRVSLLLVLLPFVSALFPPADSSVHPVCGGDPVVQLQHPSLMGLYTFNDWITDPKTQTIRNRALPTSLPGGLLPNLTIVDPAVTNFCKNSTGLCCAGGPFGPFGFGTVSGNITGNAALALSGGIVTMAVWFTPNKNQTLHAPISQLIAGMARWSSISDMVTQSPNIGNGIYQNTEVDIALLSTLPGAGATINRMQFEAQVLEKQRVGPFTKPFYDQPMFVFSVYLNNTVSELHSGVVAIQIDDLPQPYETWWDNISINEDYSSYYSPASVVVQYTFRGPSAAGLSRLFLGSCAQNIQTFPFNMCWQGTINMLAIYSTSRIADASLNTLLNGDISMPSSPAVALPSQMTVLQDAIPGSMPFQLATFDYDAVQYNCTGDITVRIIILPKAGTLYYDSTGHGNWVAIPTAPFVLPSTTNFSFVPINGLLQFGAGYAYLTFTASDNGPLLPASPTQANVTFNVMPVDYPPIGTNSTYSIPPDQFLTITLTGTDPDNIPARRNLPGVSGNLSAVVILSLPADGTLTYNAHLIIPLDLPYKITFVRGVQAATLTYLANAPLITQSGQAVTAIDLVKFNVLDGLGLASVNPAFAIINVLNPLQPSPSTAATLQVRTQYDRNFQVPVLNFSTIPPHIVLQLQFWVSGLSLIQLNVTNSLPPTTDPLGIQIVSIPANGILFFNNEPVINNISSLGKPPPLIPIGAVVGTALPDIIFYNSGPITTYQSVASLPVLTAPVLQYFPFNTTVGNNSDSFGYRIVNLVSTFKSAVFQKRFYVNDPPLWFGPSQLKIFPAITNSPTFIPMILLNGDQTQADRFGTLPIQISITISNGDGTVTLAHPELYNNATFSEGTPILSVLTTFTATLAVAAALVSNVTFIPTFFGGESVTFTATDTNPQNGLVYNPSWVVTYNVVLPSNSGTTGTPLLPAWLVDTLYAIGAIAAVALIFLFIWFLFLACGLKRHFARLSSSGGKSGGSGGGNATAGASKGSSAQSSRRSRARVGAYKGAMSRPSPAAMPSTSTKIKQAKTWQKSTRSSSTQGTKGKYMALEMTSRSSSDKGYSSIMSLNSD